jgi:hypothetical protein
MLRLVLLPLRHMSLTVIAAAIAIEGMLATRFVLQLTYEPQVVGVGSSVLRLSDSLVSPFRGLEGTVPLTKTGVVEFATLTAMEVYLVAAVVVVVLLSFWSEMLHVFRLGESFRGHGNSACIEGPPGEQEQVVRDELAA